MTHALAEPVVTFNVVCEAAVLSNLAPGRGHLRSAARSPAVKNNGLVPGGDRR
jgi:hypothetical protein